MWQIMLQLSEHDNSVCTIQCLFVLSAAYFVPPQRCTLSRIYTLCCFRRINFLSFFVGLNKKRRANQILVLFTG